MGRKPKFKYEEKINAMYEYQEGKCSFNDIAKRIGAHVSTVESWWMLYKSQGENGLRETHINKQWSKEIKSTAVLDYLSGKGSLMAVVGIVMKFFQIVISIVIGMAAGCIPIVGFNMGAKLSKRVKDLFTKLLIAEACVGAVAFIIVELFPNVLIQVFGAANESIYYTDFAVKAFRIYLCMMILACINKATFIFLQAMGKAVASTMLSVVREIVFGVGFALILPIFFGLDGVLYSMPVSDILTFIIAVILVRNTYKELKAEQ